MCVVQHSAVSIHCHVYSVGFLNCVFDSNFPNPTLPSHSSTSTDIAYYMMLYNELAIYASSPIKHIHCNFCKICISSNSITLLGAEFFIMIFSSGKFHFTYDSRMRTFCYLIYL